MATRPEEELNQLLYRGGEHLAAGNPGDARPFLERALHLQPKNEKAQNLLGLTYFKLGILADAATIYEQLVRDNPADPTLRVNLGLVYLKAQQLNEAVREFEAATDLAPDHAKAHNYLGLALAQMGDYARAREHFLLAGSDAMAEKMARAVEGEVAAAKQQASSAPALTLPAPLEVARPTSEETLGIEVLSDEDAEVPLGQVEEISVDSVQVTVAPAPAVPPVADVDGNWGDAVGPEADDLRFAEDEGPPAPPMPEEETLLVAQDPEESPSPGVAPPSQAEVVQLPPRELSPRDAEAPAPPSLDPPGMTQVFGLAQLRQEAFGSAGAPSMPLSISPTPPATVPSPPVFEVVESALEPNEETFSFPTSAPSRAGPSLQAHLREFAPSLYSDAPRLGGGFVIGSELVMLPVQGELYARLGDLVASVGALEMKPAQRRVRGRLTQELFGSQSPFSRVSGVGRVWLWAKGKGCVATKVADESLYVREERIVAFDDSVGYENGRIANPGEGDLSLLHLSGKGKVLLAVEGLLRSVEVLGDVPLSVSVDHWVGWFGKLTPKLHPPSNGHGRTVELTGEGVVLLRLPALE